tara:strand:- start:251 stop:1522 length:1272 start_codon:yes stop_codon:yes gene_type:complete
MVGKHIILDDDYYQRRFYCFGGDGGGGGGGGNDGPQTNPGSRERGREDSIGSITVVDRTNPAAMRQREQDYVSDRLNTTNEKFAEMARSPAFREAQKSEQQAVKTSMLLAGGYGGADPGPSTAPPYLPTMTDRQMLAASANPNLNPFPAPSAAVTAALTPTVSPGSNNAEQAELVRQLVENAAEQSLEQGGGTDILDSVESVPGRNDPGSGFFADAYDALYGTPDPNDDPVTAPGTAVGSIFGASPVMNLFGGNTPDPADAAAFNVGQLQRMAQATGTGTVNPETGAVTGVQAGRGTLSMNPFGGVVYSGVNDPTYTGAFQNLVRGTAGLNGTENDRPSDNQTAMQPADAPMDPGTTTPEQIDDLAVNYLQNPYYLYSGQGNLFQPYGYAGNTLVDLLQTRNMRMPDQAAPNLGLFGNLRDFS